MKYKDFVNKRQEDFNSLPIFFAFGRKQFEEALEARGIKPEEAREHIYRLGDTGGYYLKKDAPVIREFFMRDYEANLRKEMEADLSLAYEAFEYEMFNHEYPINLQGDYDVCSNFGAIEWDEMKGGTEYLEELGFSAAVIKEYFKAANHVAEVIEY